MCLRDEHFNIFLILLTMGLSLQITCQPVSTKNRTQSIDSFNQRAIPILSWIIKFSKDVITNTKINSLSERSGLINAGIIGNMTDHYLFFYCNSSSQRGLNCSWHRWPALTHQQQSVNLNDSFTIFYNIQNEVERFLEAEDIIEWYSQEVVKLRIPRRSIDDIHFKDPQWPSQWHLFNRVNRFRDINVTSVWSMGITGKGVVVCVLDDGVDHKNADLINRYNSRGSYNLNHDTYDPMPSTSSKNNYHGTRCAGEIVAEPNNFCGIGVAYDAQISAIKVLDGPITDGMEAIAFTFANEINHIYSISWGPLDNGAEIDGPHLISQQALKHGVTYGRHGAGSIFVVASGNGGAKGDDCNYDGYANSLYTITIGAVNEFGGVPNYAEKCAPMLAVTYSSGGRSIITTDWQEFGHTGCTNQHSGTSAAAPIAAGLIALMLQVRPCLTWRDIKHIIALSSYKIDKKNGDYAVNGAGLWHSHMHGFGALDAWRLVQVSKAWPLVPSMRHVSSRLQITSEAILAGKNITLILALTRQYFTHKQLNSIEYVQVAVNVEHERRGDLQFELISPQGTRSILAHPRPYDNSSRGFNWRFSSVRCWGESPFGLWTLVIHDGFVFPNDTIKSARERGKLNSWKLYFTGSVLTQNEMLRRIEYVNNITSGREVIHETLKCPASYSKPHFFWFLTFTQTFRLLFLILLMCIVYFLVFSLVMFGQKFYKKGKTDDEQDCSVTTEASLLLEAENRGMQR